MKKLLPEENLFLQVFLNDGTNYLEDKAITNHIIGQNVKLNIPIEFTQYVSEIRLDPLNVSCVLQNLKVQIVTKDNNEYEIEHYRHNAIITKDHDFIFASEDPQIIFENQWENNVREIKIAFRIRLRRARNTSASGWQGWCPARWRSEERRVGKECRSRWSPDH